MAKHDYYSHLCNLNVSDNFDPCDKIKSVKEHTAYMLDRTSEMFVYNNLPNSIPSYMLELMLKVNGYVGIIKHEDNLYAVFGGLGGVPDAYYRPTELIVANPYLKLSKTFKIDKDCVIIKNDSMLLGLMPMFHRYSHQLTENEISIRCAQIITRMQTAIVANDDATYESAEKYIKDLMNGKLSAIADEDFISSLKVMYNNGTSSALTDLIELEQYIKASWYNDIGLNANYNMKRERISATESQMNNDSLLPLVDNMYRCRVEGFNKVKDMFGVEISVDYGSSWKVNQFELSNSSQLESEDGDYEES